MAMDSSQQGATAIPLCQDQPPSELLEDSTENLPESSPTRMEDDGREEDVKENEDLSKRYLPCVQMEFESEQEAYDFYNEYARISGFCVRRHWRTLSKIDGILIARMFVCNKEGQKEIDKRSLVVEQPHKETRTNCLASMYVSLNRNTSKWVVKKFEENHNHVLHLPEHSHLLKSHRMVSEAQAINIDIAADIGLSLKASHDLLSAQAGGKECLGFTREDQKNYLRTRRQRSLKFGESGALLGYFRNQAAQNPYFYYAVQLDKEDMITNIFWADHEMITDYALFGDAMSFDTTFRTNKEYRPFALFAGFNHFRMTCIFGAALLYDETAESFEWLFKTFLHALSGKKPITIFTDQDAAMAKAIKSVLPDVSHGLCTFHLNQNALKHLGHLFNAESDFGKELNACIFGYEEPDELKKAWETLVQKYNLKDNTWMAKTWEIKEKWAHVYMKWSFTTGMRSTQLSESLNAKLKKCLKSDLNIVQFFTQWDTIVLEKRYEESKAIFNSREKFQRTKLKESPILIQVSQVYSPPLFDLFHNEVDASLRCVVKPCLEFGGQFNFFISKYREKVKYVVKGSVETDEFGETICRDICCSCRKFESFGILCCHALSGLHRMGVFEIPERYLLGRWRLDAKDCGLEKEKTRVDENDPKLQKAARFRIICPKMVKLATRSCEVQEAYEFVEETVEYMCAKVANILLGSEEEGCTDAESEELEKHIDHAATTTIVHGSSLKQQPDVYIPQMVSYEDGSQSIASSSQASHNPQTLKEMSCDPASHSSWGGNNFMDNEAFLEMLSYSGCPQKNLK
ncbi:hypothetical protein RHMOL_Rhmol06G0152000 [Rhododendron molle]|uniref:Uncharacterized protein n=1 Tax=Rhododendron molle TaxID=49168 RepID=A0ACC0NDV0_RHOML|nr:hypothetical protein RHMOL_Rhmol06G0152000 [Rhododendron molle]